MLPRLCRMPQQLCAFPTRSLLLIMFPLRVELQLNMLNARVWKRIAKSVVQVSPPFPCQRKQISFFFFFWAGWRTICSPPLKKKYISLTVFFLRIVFRPCFVFHLSKPLSPRFNCTTVLCLCPPDQCLLCTAVCWETGLLAVIARGSLIPKNAAGFVCVFIQTLMQHAGGDGKEWGGGGGGGVWWEGGGGGQQAERPDPNLSLHKTCAWWKCCSRNKNNVIIQISYFSAAVAAPREDEPRLDKRS